MKNENSLFGNTGETPSFRKFCQEYRHTNCFECIVLMLLLLNFQFHPRLRRSANTSNVLNVNNNNAGGEYLNSENQPKELLVLKYTRYF